MKKVIIVLGIILVSSAMADNEKRAIRYRLRMVEQLQKETIKQPKSITDKKLLEIMREIPRHKFVGAKRISEAYVNRTVYVRESHVFQYSALQPYLAAFMIQSLQLEANDKVLMIGVHSGYMAAVISEMTDPNGLISGIDINERTIKHAKKALEEHGYKKIKVKKGDSYCEWKEHAPFDAIVVTVATSEIPKPLIDQLAEGGRMVIPIGQGRIQKLTLVKKQEKKITQESLTAVSFSNSTYK